MHLKQGIFAIEDENFVISFAPSCDSELCCCELPYPKDLDGNFLFTKDTPTVLFTKLAAIKCDTYKLVCQNNKCVLRWDGRAENIYRISGQICIVEELLWNFIDSVILTKANFSSFCNLVDIDYTRNGSSRKFVSPKTFSKAFFSWASHQPREFRRGCNWCGSNPNILACDGTKIGIMQINTSIDPIEKTNGMKITTTERRMDRCFLSYPDRVDGQTVDQHKEKEKNVRDSRLFLRYITKKKSTQQKKKSKKKDNNPKELNDLNEIEFESYRVKLLDVFPKECTSLLTRYMNSDMTTIQKECARQIFYLLSYEAPIRAFLPSVLSSSLVSVLDLPTIDNVTMFNFILECKKYNPALGEFIKSFYDGSVIHSDVKSLLRYLCVRLRDSESLYTLAEPAVEIPDSYNPSRLGRFYYFSETGQQIRTNREFSVEKKNETSSTCSKYYPTVAKRGSTFLFLWFCPAHGHCYGGHMVNGSEGRKDAMCSLYTHLPQPPEIIFYDNACQLEEYSLNREADFFRITRFYHDHFHGFAHKCSCMYSCMGLEGMGALNTSICEQFNAFLQCIKSAGKHMSQDHFMFFCQFMIDIWNTKKMDTVQKKFKSALNASQ
eukprot:TCONS_00059786-protein